MKEEKSKLPWIQRIDGKSPNGYVVALIGGVLFALAVVKIILFFID